ncbi:mediator complex subunit, partial [Tulasnella sp. 427]
QHHQQNTTTATSLQAHTPLAVAQTPSGRTPSNNNNLPRTPGGPFGKQHARTPTASGLRDSGGGSSRRPGQAKAQIFFEKLFMSAVAIVAEAVSSLAAGDAVAAAESQIVLRQAFVFGRLPELIATFQDFASASSSSAKANQPKFRSAVEQALATIFTSHASLLDACDPPKKGKGTILGDGQMMDITTGDDLMKDGSDEQKGSPFRRNLLTALARRNLISLDAAKALYPPLATSHETGAADTSMDAMEVAGHPFSSEGIVLEPGRIEVLAQESVANKQDYCDWVLLNGSPDEVWNILEAMLDDFSGQAAVAVSVQKVFGQSTGTHEGLERLCALCKVLAETSNVLDVLSLHLCISELVADGLAIVDDFDVSSTGDTQLAYTQLGSIILFLQLCSYQYGLPEVVVSRNGRKLSAEYLTASWAVYHPRSFSEDERNLMKIWHNNVFAGQTEGLDERLLRQVTTDQTRMILLHMGASLFSEALANKTMDVNALISGAVAYFLEPVFNWSLVGIVRGLADEALRKGYSASSNLKVIHAIVTAGS